VSRAIQILKDEMEMNCRLIGAPTLKDVTPDMVRAVLLSLTVSSTLTLVALADRHCCTRAPYRRGRARLPHARQLRASRWRCVVVPFASLERQARSCLGRFVRGGG